MPSSFNDHLSLTEWLLHKVYSLCSILVHNNTHLKEILYQIGDHVKCLVQNIGHSTKQIAIIIIITLGTLKIKDIIHKKDVLSLGGF